MKLVIFGASGLIGGRLSEFFKKKKINLIKISRTKKRGFKKINHNSTISLNNVLKNTDIVINCIGADVHKSKKFKEAVLLNRKYPKKIYDVANKNKVRLFIFISTYHVYDFSKKRISETTRVTAKDNHTKSKILGENQLIKTKKKYTKLLIVRSCNLFGKAKYPNKNVDNLIINSFIKNIKKNQKFIIKSKKNDIRYYSSLENFCNFLYKVIISKKIKYVKKTKVINYTSNKKFSILQLVNYLRKKILLRKKISPKIFFKHAELNKDKDFIFTSSFQKKNNLITDKFFEKEIFNLIK